MDGSQKSKLVELAAGTEFFHCPNQVAYATIDMGTHKETHALNSRDFERWLRKKSYDQTGAVPRAQPVADAICVFEAQAVFSGQEHDVCLRVGEHKGRLVIDLCNPTWEVVIVDAAGWHVETCSPIKFRRTRGMLPLPTPVEGGELSTLRDFVNVANEDEWYLLIVLILGIMRPRGPYPVGCLQGEQGSGKSTVVRIIRALTDPSISPVRCEPREQRDLIISAQNSWVIAFDNLSYIPPWLSDALCRLSTGGGFATRQLFTDQDEIILDAQRPVIVNGIDSLITRSDLLDRSVLITLPMIDEPQRRSEADLLKAFEEARPRLFGAMLTALSKILVCLPEVHLDRLPRMADFALFGVACERALGWPPGIVLAAYERNRSETHMIALEGSPIVVPIEELLANLKEWKGTATDLLQELSCLASPELTRRRGWPMSERQLGAQLARLAPNFRAVGLIIEKTREGHSRTRTITLRKSAIEGTLSGSSACPQVLAVQGVVADNGADNLTRKETQIVRQNSKLRAVADKAVKADKEKPPSAEGDSRVHPRLKELKNAYRPAKPINRMR